MSHDVENDHRTFNIVADTVVTDPVAPPPHLGPRQFLAPIRISVNPAERVENLSLNFRGESTEVVLKAFSRDETK